MCLCVFPSWGQFVHFLYLGVNVFLCQLVFLPTRMLQAGIVFDGVCVSVCVSVRTKSRKPLVWNRCSLVGICPMRNAINVKVGDLDLWPWPVTLSYFIFAMHMSSSIRSYECLHIATSFSVWRYIFMNIYLTFEVQGHGVNIKVTTAK